LGCSCILVQSQNSEWIFERHPLKAVTALAVFIKNAAHCIKRTYAVGDMREVVLAVIKIPVSSDELLDVEKGAEELGVHVDTVRKWIHEKQLRAVS
jgi:hypothetical protein